jgi:DNA-binding MarR family transcriptional regulator
MPTRRNMMMKPKGESRRRGAAPVAKQPPKRNAENALNKAGKPAVVPVSERAPGTKLAVSGIAGNDKTRQPNMPLWLRPGYLLRRLHQIHYALFFEECAGFDITPVQYGLLTTLAVSPDLDQNSIGRELGIDRTNVADVLARLARRGLLERYRSKQDRRMVLARLTPAGRRITDEMYAAMLRAQNRLVAPLPAEERKAFIDTLLRLIEGNNHLGRTIYTPR